MNIVMLVLVFIASFVIAIPLSGVFADSTYNFAQLATAVSFANTVLLVVGISMVVKRLDVITKDIKLLKEKDKKETKEKNKTNK